MSIVFGGVKVFDQSVVGATPFYTSVGLQKQIAAAEKFSALVKTTSVTGTSPTIVLRLEHSNDGVNWVTKADLIGPTPVAITSTYLATPQDTGTTNVGGAMMRLAVVLGGAGSLGAYVEIWLTGRTLD